MLLDAAETIAVSNQGWVDKGALWTFDLANRTVAHVPLGDFDYLDVQPGDGERFVVRAQLRHGGFVASVRAFADPARALAEAELSGGGDVELRGDTAAWRGMPSAFAGYAGPGYALLLIAADGGSASADRLDWFNSESYDLDYQGLGTPLQLPDSGHVIVPIQRSSEPVVYDPGTRRVVDRLSLAGNFGNPTLRMSPDGAELWADDYDTLLRLDARSLRVKDKRRLQPAAGGTGQFIGRWSFTADGARCVVAPSVLG